MLKQRETKQLNILIHNLCPSHNLIIIREAPFTDDLFYTRHLVKIRHVISYLQQTDKLVIIIIPLSWKIKTQKSYLLTQDYIWQYIKAHRFKRQLSDSKSLPLTIRLFGEIKCAFLKALNKNSDAITIKCLSSRCGAWQTQVLNKCLWKASRQTGRVSRQICSRHKCQKKLHLIVMGRICTAEKRPFQEREIQRPRAKRLQVTSECVWQE